MNDNSLQDFIASTTAKNRITFGDVRRVARDHLPDGVLTREEAQTLIALDAKIARVDRAWTSWLVASIVDFAVWSDPSVGANETVSHAWLEKLISVGELCVETRARTMREIRRALLMISSSWDHEPIDATNTIEVPDNAVLPSATARDAEVTSRDLAIAA